MVLYERRESSRLQRAIRAENVTIWSAAAGRGFFSQTRSSRGVHVTRRCVCDGNHRPKFVGSVCPLDDARTTRFDLSGMTPISSITRVASQCGVEPAHCSENLPKDVTWGAQIGMNGLQSPFAPAKGRCSNVTHGGENVLSRSESRLLRTASYFPHLGCRDAA
jgi:hypothetical protein